MLTFQLRQPLEDGMEVRVVGSPTLFKKGKFTFRPRSIEFVGDGSLKRAYELLKQQLEDEGLFDERRKRSLPRFPQRIGVVTSKDAAAYTDVLRILKNRWAGLDIRHMNVNVQGAQAASSIVSALEEMNKTQKDLDCIILTRGGGSLEDLQAFNSEEVVRAIFGSAIPVVSAVGHERDVTLADLVADVRASTPSNAAEMVVPDKKDVVKELGYMSESMQKYFLSNIQKRQQQIFSAVQVVEGKFHSSVADYQALRHRLHSAIQQHQSQLHFSQKKIDHCVQLLRSYHPDQILQRGFTLTFDQGGRLVRTSKQIKKGQNIQTQFVDGKVQSRVE